MSRRGFTLIEVIVGLALLGLISITIIPILNSSILNIIKSKIRLEMSYIGEKAIERIKAYDEEENNEGLIFDTNISDIIDSFRKSDKVDISLYKEKKGEKYKLQIIKEDRPNGLWMMNIYVYHNKEGSNLPHVEYKTYLLAK